MSPPPKRVRTGACRASRIEREPGEARRIRRVANVGGLVGKANRLRDAASLSFTSCANYGKLTGSTVVGGLFGLGFGQGWTSGELTIVNSANYGDFDPAGNSPVTGALVGKLSNNNANFAPTVTVENCWWNESVCANTIGAPDATVVYTEKTCQTSATGTATALAALNAVALQKSWVSWVEGETGYPELAIFGAAGPSAFAADGLSAEVAADGRTATISVTISNVSVSDATLSLLLNGREVASWPLANGTFTEENVRARLGEENTYAFVATKNGETLGSVDGTFLPVEHVDWFDVQFSDAGYVPGVDWIEHSVDKDGGTWSQTAEGASVLSTTRYACLDATDAVAYVPSKPSRKNFDVLVEGRMAAEVSDPSARPSDAPFALTFALDADTLKVYPVAYANGVWTRVGEAEYAYGTWIDYKVECDHQSGDAPLVRVTIGTEIGAWMQVQATEKSVTAVGFTGGTIGDFRGSYSRLRRSEGLVLLVL